MSNSNGGNRPGYDSAFPEHGSRKEWRNEGVVAHAVAPLLPTVSALSGDGIANWAL